jgi:hypothetical protein
VKQLDEARPSTTDPEPGLHPINERSSQNISMAATNIRRGGRAGYGGLIVDAELINKCDSNQILKTRQKNTL